LSALGISGSNREPLTCSNVIAAEDEAGSGAGIDVATIEEEAAPATPGAGEANGAGEAKKLLPKERGKPVNPSPTAYPAKKSFSNEAIRVPSTPLQPSSP